jgi:Mlc titration factor MtfA (ptsG expression regulator)
MMSYFGLICFIFSVFVLIFAISKWQAHKKKKKLEIPFPLDWEAILNDKIHFYSSLDENEKIRFKNKIKSFLNNTHISGVKGVVINDTIRLMVASSAIIPIFRFEEWDYINLSEVLIYDGAVVTNQSSDQETDGIILGQVRPFQNRHLLLLSKQSLENGFVAINGKGNVGFHEFSHLIDEADGSIDGIPKILMSEALLASWTKLMHKEIQEIQKKKSDINPYALTNHAEFFAVVCEYFFENPELFKKNHSDLYLILSEIFKKNDKIIT